LLTGKLDNIDSVDGTNKYQDFVDFVPPTLNEVLIEVLDSSIALLPRFSFLWDSILAGTT